MELNAFADAVLAVRSSAVFLFRADFARNSNAPFRTTDDVWLRDLKIILLTGFQYNFVSIKPQRFIN